MNGQMKIWMQLMRAAVECKPNTNECLMISVNQWSNHLNALDMFVSELLL